LLSRLVDRAVGDNDYLECLAGKPGRKRLPDHADVVEDLVSPVVNRQDRREHWLDCNHPPRLAVPFGPVTEPARWGRRRSLLDLFDRVRLARPAVRAYELGLATRSSLRGKEPQAADGLPLPPARLRAQVGPLHADGEFFLSSGKHNADLIREILLEVGTPVEQLEALLDWGCGCGRVLRHWANLSSTGVFGCDITPKMVDWCNEHLPFADASVNELSPPLPYEESSFDLVYAFSVMTHLSADLQRAWVAESRRVLKPGGYFLFSTLGEYFVSRNRLTNQERRSFESGNLVVLYESSAGTSLCSAYHPPDYVRRELAGEFDVAAFRPAADDGRHDIHVLRKPLGS
jgi:SAM-dependent methyltransferase